MRISDWSSDVCSSDLPQTFADKGAKLFYTTDDGGEFAFLVRQDLVTGERVTVFQPDWDVQGANLSRDARTLIVSVNEDARSRPYLLDAATFAPRLVADPMPAAKIGRAEVGESVGQDWSIW